MQWKISQQAFQRTITFMTTNIDDLFLIQKKNKLILAVLKNDINHIRNT
jgi:hypothetical protein